VFATRSASATPKVALGRQFGWLWSSSALANAGDGMSRALLPLLVVARNPDPLAVSGLTAVNMLPWLLLALPAGAITDRHDKRAILLASNLVRACALLAAYLAYLGHGALSVLYVLAFVLGVAETFAETAAPAVLPSIVGPDALGRANARLSVPQIIFNEMAGPPVAGLLIGIGATVALATGGSLYAVAAILLIGLSAVGPAAGERGRRSIWHDISGGLAYVAGHRVLSRTIAASALYGLVYSATFSLLVLFSYRTLHLNATGYGLLLSVGSVGSLLGSFLAARLMHALGPVVLLRWSLVLSGLAYVGLGMSRFGVLAAAVIFCNGVFTMCWNIPVVSLRQSLTSPGLQGRVTSLARLCAWGSMPLGALAGGVLGRLVSVPVVFVAAGCALIVGCPLLLGRLSADLPADRARAEIVTQTDERTA
jgi:Na+/melibiose symporter-like transporter